jgi:hypothetical protein
MRLHLDHAQLDDLLAYLDADRERVALLRTNAASDGYRVSGEQHLDDDVDPGLMCAGRFTCWPRLPAGRPRWPDR